MLGGYCSLFGLCGFNFMHTLREYLFASNLSKLQLYLDSISEYNSWAVLELLFGASKLPHLRIFKQLY